MISVIIPTLNDQARLAPCLAALGPGLMAGLVREVIFADGGSTDDTAAIADAVGAVLVDAPGGPAAQIAAGVAAAKGPWLLILPPTVALSTDWPDSAEHHVARHPDQAGWFHQRRDAQGLWPWLAARWANCRAGWLAQPAFEQGLLISLATCAAVGGYPHGEPGAHRILARRLGRRRLRGLAAVALVLGTATGPTG